jgi:hypothetical protein
VRCLTSVNAEERHRGGLQERSGRVTEFETPPGPFISIQIDDEARTSRQMNPADRERASAVKPAHRLPTALLDRRKLSRGAEIRTRDL